MALQSQKMDYMPIIETPPGRQLNQLQAKNDDFSLEANLKQATECIVIQQVDLVNLVVGYKMPNHYQVLNKSGVPFLDVREDSDDAARACFGESRDLVLLMFNKQGERVMSVYRPFQCCGQTLRVEYPAGRELAVIERTNVFCCCSRQHFSISVADNTAPPMYLLGPPICTGCCSDVTYDIINSSSEEKMGQVQREWSFYAQETNADKFHVQFHPDASIPTKIIILASTFLIDLTNYEHRSQSRRRGGGGRFNSDSDEW